MSEHHGASHSIGQATLGHRNSPINTNGANRHCSWIGPSLPFRHTNGYGDCLNQSFFSCRILHGPLLGHQI